MSEKNLHLDKIELRRGNQGLGFNIRGGRDDQFIHGDPGIFISKVMSNGAAAEDGRLKRGDKILEINGTKVEGMSHSEAVSLFRKSGDTVQLLVHMGAEKHIMETQKAAKEAILLQSLGRDSSESSVPLAMWVIGGAAVAGLSLFLAYRLTRDKT